MNRDKVFNKRGQGGGVGQQCAAGCVRQWQAINARSFGGWVEGHQNGQAGSKGLAAVQKTRRFSQGAGGPRYEGMELNQMAAAGKPLRPSCCGPNRALRSAGAHTSWAG